MVVDTSKSEEIDIDLPTMQLRVVDMLENGIHFGHVVRVRHPAMYPYLLGTFGNIVIIDVAKTIGMIYENVVPLLTKVVKEKAPILFVGTKKFAQSIIQEVAETCNEYYVNSRWLGGMLTNARVVSLAMNKFVQLEELLQKELEMPSMKKKERARLSKEVEKLQVLFNGCKGLDRLPGVLIVLDVGEEYIAIQEARSLGIPVIGVVDTNSDPRTVSHPIPANDDSHKSISFILTTIAKYILDMKCYLGRDVGESEDMLGEDAFVDKYSSIN